MTFRSSKTLEHFASCAFRQHGASHSHCRFLHGYALSARLDFEGPLDSRNWVVDFGDFKVLKRALEDQFDHKTVVAEDDPGLDWFITANHQRLLELRIVKAVGIEAFAKLTAEITIDWLNRVYKPADYSRKDVKLVKVELWEHGANSAMYLPG